jgi:hypothetical protein
MVSMITNDADLDLEGTELGWGWNPFKAVKKAAKGVASVGKGVAKGVAKGAGKVATTTAKTAYTGGKFGLKTAYKGGKLATKTAYKGGKFAVKQAMRIPKALADLALWPVRSQLSKLKSRRASLLAVQNRGTKTPTMAEKAQARKDVKSMLSAKGPHGKMLAYLAGGESLFAGELGVVGYDDAALAAISTALLSTAVKIVRDAASSKFAPVDALKAGLKTGGSTGFEKLTDTSAGQKTAAAYRALETRAGTAATAADEYATRAAAFVPEEEAAEPVTPDEVAAEPIIEAEEEALDAETEEFAGALAGAGLLGGFMEAAPAAAVPEAMPQKTARRIALASQQLLCRMSRPALVAIGGIHAPQIASALCQGMATGDDATVRAALPGAVQIAARISADIASQAVTRGLPNDGFGGIGTAGDDLREIGMLAAFDGADPEGLAYGLAGVGVSELRAASTGSALVPVAAGLITAVGLWFAWKKR